MPQMSPTNWMILYVWFTLLFMMIIILNYYFFLYKPPKMIIKYKKITSHWKW
uniref:ATP synthase complex subunit 8 n=1 Tax=Curculionoidea sp. 2 KM-2017 TaxID=2219403 RepID=A0A346RKM6_9CUCU|nr:ATP synthase F0 subunit 8 [Curculionoidea sp. 2 KM-2017]